MRFTVGLLVFSLMEASAFQGASIQPLGPLGPVLERLYLDTAVPAIDNARRLESSAQWQQALAQYTQIINQAQAALGQPLTAQDPTVYYVLGLADTDSARMFRYLQVDQLFHEQYGQYLANAEQAFRNADILYRQRGIEMWAIPGALATVHILQGDLLAARQDIQRVQTADPRYQPAAVAAQQLGSLPPAVTQAASTFRTNRSTLTPQQWSLLENAAKTIVLALVPPAYQKAVAAGITITTVGVALYRQWQQTTGAAQ